MNLQDFLSNDRITVTNSTDKNAVFETLASLIAKDSQTFSKDEILQRIHEREELFTTRITDAVAIPHAKIPGFPEPMLAVAICQEPIIYDSDKDHRVKLLILIVSDDTHHLELLAELAKLLNDQDVYQLFLHADTVEKIYPLFNNTPDSQRSLKTTKKQRYDQDSQTILNMAFALSQELNISAICYHAFHEDQLLTIPKPDQHCSIFLALASSSKSVEQKDYKTVVLPFHKLDRMNRVELSMISLISEKLVKQNERVLHILGSAEEEALDTIIISDAAEYSFLFSLQKEDTPSDLEQRVFMRMLQLANELAQEGREGKPVGALYVLGDSELVLEHTQQMVVNPFGGYKEDDRNVLDPGLQATIKEFSKIDGASIVRGDGVLLSCGTYIKAGSDGDSAHRGYGARHTAAANISTVSDAIAIVLSESTRRISVFKNGIRIMYL